MVLYVVPEGVWVAVIVAPSKALPDASLTTPLILLVVTWADAVKATNSARKNDK
jgi:hypothetical protein